MPPGAVAQIGRTSMADVLSNQESGSVVKTGEKPGFWRGQALCANTAALCVGYSGSLFALYLWCLSNIAVCYMQVPLQRVSNSGSLFALYG